MDLMVYLNGNFVKACDAKVSIYDHGFLYGDGVFETLRAYKKYVLRFENHIQRLYNSLKHVKMALPIAPTMIYKAVQLLLQYNQFADSYIRISITRGEGPIGLDISLCPQSTILIVAEAFRGYPASWYSHGISTVISHQRKIPDISFPSSVKSCNYLPNILAKKDAWNKGAQEAILLNMEGYVAEGTVSNIFLVKDKRLLTPAISSGVLSGITRELVIELAESKNIEVEERHIFPKEIFTADECFLTNTTMEVMPVTFCDGTKIGNGSPGKVTKQLTKEYKKLIETEIKKER